MIEVELRGYLDKTKAKEFQKYLVANANSKEVYKEVAMFFDTANIPTLGNFYTGIGRIQANQKKSGYNRVTQKIKIKLNEPSSDGRVEYELILANNGLDGFFEMLKRFGVTKAVFKPCRRLDFKLKDMEVSLKYGHPLGDHFEAEIQCKTEKQVANATTKLKKFLAQFGLDVWSQNEYKKIITDNAYKTPYIEFDEGKKLLK